MDILIATLLSTNCVNVNGELISMNYLGNEYFYVKNIQGDILESVNQSGITVAKYRY